MNSLPLSPEHIKTLTIESAISLKVAETRFYQTVRDAKEAEQFGFLGANARPGMIIPIYGVDGRCVTYQLRADDPWLVNGKRVRYKTLPGSRLCLDIHPLVLPKLADPSIPLTISEGAKKVDSAISHGLTCIGLLGVWGWRGTNKVGGKTELSDWSAIALNKRQVIIAFDSDVLVKESVRKAVDGLSAFLDRKGASVRFAILGGSGNV